MTHADMAAETFDKGFNCAQSVVSSYANELHIDRDMVFKLATGFGGGLGRKQEVCGAVSGGVMVLGLLHGRDEHMGKECVDKTYSEVRDLIDAFVREHGTICCRELLSGCSLLTDEGRKRFAEDRLVEQCQKYIRTVCTILDRTVQQPES